MSTGGDLSQTPRHHELMTKVARAKNTKKKNKQRAKQEACLYHAGGVAEIAWIPEDTDHPTCKDPATKKLLGKYALKNCHLDQAPPDGSVANLPLFEVHPDSDWVEKNFKPR